MSVQFVAMSFSNKICTICGGNLRYNPNRNCGETSNGRGVLRKCMQHSRILKQNARELRTLEFRRPLHCSVQAMNHSATALFNVFNSLNGDFVIIYCHLLNVCQIICVRTITLANYQCEDNYIVIRRNDG